MKKIIRITTVAGSLRKLLGNQLLFMKNYYDVVIASQNNDNDLTILGEKMELKAQPLNLTRKITPVTDFITLIKTIFFLIKEKPFIVHTHTPKAGLIGMIASKIVGVPNRLHTVAGLPLIETIGIKRKILKFTERITYKCATKVYPNSYGLKKILVEENLISDTNKLKVIGHGSSNGIDTSHFSPENITTSQKNDVRNELNITNEDFVFIFIGRIVKDKGINELINAFNKIDKKHNNVKLILLGRYENDLDPINHEEMSIIKNNSNILHLGFQEDIRPYLAISHILAFPSYREGFPNVVMQASSMEIPSIVSNINGCNEIIKDEVNGKIIPVKNTIALFEAMEFFMNKRGDLKNYGKKARELICDNYKQEYVWSELLKEYKSLN